MVKALARTLGGGAHARAWPPSGAVRGRRRGHVSTVVFHTGVIVHPIARLRRLATTRPIPACKVSKRTDR